MGIFDKMKNALSGSGVVLEKWNVLETVEQVEEVIAASKNRPQLIYKHSYRCSICVLALEEIEDSFDTISEQAAMNFVDVVKSRSVSNGFTQQLGVRHESPQALIIHKGKVVWSDSHHSIKVDAILEALNGLN